MGNVVLHKGCWITWKGEGSVGLPGDSPVREQPFNTG